jgi:hypothetical protein
MIETIWLHTIVKDLENHHLYEVMRAKMYDENDGFVEIWDLGSGGKMIITPRQFFDGYQTLTIDEVAHEMLSH